MDLSTVLSTYSLSLSLGNHNNLTIETKVGLNIWLLLFEYPAMTFSGHKSNLLHVIPFSVFTSVTTMINLLALQDQQD